MFFFFFRFSEDQFKYTITIVDLQGQWYNDAGDEIVVLENQIIFNNGHAHEIQEYETHFELMHHQTLPKISRTGGVGEIFWNTEYNDDIRWSREKIPVRRTAAVPEVIQSPNSTIINLNKILQPKLILSCSRFAKSQINF